MNYRNFDIETFDLEDSRGSGRTQTFFARWPPMNNSGPVEC
jgi:hypothetical protein